MGVRWLDAVGGEDVATAGGKGASLGELVDAGLSVPPGFVVTADSYRRFLETSGIAGELFDAVDVDVEDAAALAEAERRARELVMETPLPEDLAGEIEAAYDAFDGDPFVAVRSSATAEDLPEASFAGTQETYLNVTGEDLLDRVKRCWASLFTRRAIYYRREQGFDDRDVDIAVVVQRMVDADASGVLFTSHPSTGAPQTIIEAAWGLGEGVVSGTVSPDNYVVDRTSGDLLDVTVADKRVEVVRDESGETVEREVSPERREARVLDDATVGELLELARRIEDHYGTPQDVEWAIADGTVYVLQSRPITTIDEGAGDVSRADVDADADDRRPTPDGAAGESPDAGAATNRPDDGIVVEGLGASPGLAAGPARVVTSLDELDRVNEGDVVVVEATTPDMVPAMQRAAAIVTDEGGMTSHAAIVSRELGLPAVVGAGEATAALGDGQPVTVDGDTGTVRRGTTTGERSTDAEAESEPGSAPSPAPEPATPAKPMTATEVLVNVSIPEAAERAAATGADGVGLLRTEHMLLSMGKTPERYVADHGADAYVDELAGAVRTVADAFYPRPVRVRTLDAPTDEFRDLEGGADEPVEANPMLGYRGIRRSLDSDSFRHELRAFAELYGMGYDNVEIMFPLVIDAGEVERAAAAMREVGLDPAARSWGVMVETPAAALRVEDLAATGIDFVSLGTNDLTQYTLAVDRNNERVADRYDALHPAVVDLLRRTIERCREAGVATSICGEAGSKPAMIDALVRAGIDSVSVNIDAVRDAQREVKRVEQSLILESVRGE